MLVNGFRKELESKSNDIKASRVELERLYALRVEDNKIDDAANVMFKEECMKALRGADANFTNLAGSIRSIKSVIEHLALLSCCILFDTSL